jgi:hypothetical protein
MCSFASSASQWVRANSNAPVLPLVSGDPSVAGARVASANKFYHCFALSLENVVSPRYCLTGTFSGRRSEDARVMPESRGRKHQSAKPTSQNQRPMKSTGARLSIVGRLTAVILGVSTLIGVPAAVIVFWPRMTVTPAGLFDESNAYSQTFTITNTGFLAFEDIHMGLGICSIETVKKDFHVSEGNCDAGGPYVLFTAPSWQTPELRRDETFVVVLTDSSTSRLTNIDQSIRKLLVGLK